MSTVHAPTPVTRPAPGAGVRTQRATQRLGGYTEAVGRDREIVTACGAHGSTLAIDGIAGARCDERLVAHLCADEPAGNARIVCSLYLADVGGRCSRARDTLNSTART